MTITVLIHQIDQVPTGLQDDTTSSVDHRNVPDSVNGNKLIMWAAVCNLCITGLHHNGMHPQLLEDEEESKPPLLPPDIAERKNDGMYKVI